MYCTVLVTNVCLYCAHLSTQLEVRSKLSHERASTRVNDKAIMADLHKEK